MWLKTIVKQWVKDVQTNWNHSLKQQHTVNIEQQMNTVWQWDSLSSSRGRHTEKVDDQVLLLSACNCWLFLLFGPWFLRCTLTKHSTLNCRNTSSHTGNSPVPPQSAVIATWQYQGRSQEIRVLLHRIFTDRLSQSVSFSLSCPDLLWPFNHRVLSGTWVIGNVQVMNFPGL